MHEVAAAGVAQVVVGRAIGAFPPDPADVEHAFAILHRPDEVGVPLAIAGEERAIDQPPPCPALRVVDVEVLVAVAAAAVAVGEDQLVPRSAKEMRIGAALLVPADHGGNSLEARYVHRPRGAEVDQRHAVHVARDVDLPRRIEGHGHRVMAVPADGRRQPRELPVVLVQPPAGDGHAALGVVEGRELPLAAGQQREADGVGRPDGGHVEGFRDTRSCANAGGKRDGEGGDF